MNNLPPMLAGDELDAALRVEPPYDETIRKAGEAERLQALQALYDVYVPTDMSREVYAKLYLALQRSLCKKQTLAAVRQFSENQNRMRGRAFTSVIGGSDSFTFIGDSGIGKSATVGRVTDLISAGRVIDLAGGMRVIPCVQVQTPADCSVKGLLFEILRRVDEILDTRYHYNAVRMNASTDMLIGSVSTAALNHIGLLAVDEIQNVVNSKNGATVVGMLTQLINNAGIGVCMVGTPKSTLFFGQEMMLARRSLGLSYGPFAFDEAFAGFCKALFRYQYVRHAARLDDGLLHWLYNHSRGNASVVVSLLHDAQETAILDGYEKLDAVSLEKAYKDRLTMLHDYLYAEPVQAKKPPAKKTAGVGSPEAAASPAQTLISDTVCRAKRLHKDPIEELALCGIGITEVSA